jgi:hypothetical protein
MNRVFYRWLVRLALVAILGGLLTYAWMADRPSPAYPQGQFGELVVFALVFVVLGAAVVAVWRAMRR